MNNKQLTIHISRTSVHVAEVFRSDQKMNWILGFDLLESNAGGYKKQLKEIFDGLNLTDDYDEYSLAWSSPNYGLTPLSVFNDSTPSAIYHLLFGDNVEENTIDFNRLMELNLVDVFEIPDWVKSFFIMRFPTLVFKHEHALTLRALFQQNTFKQKVVVTLMDDYVNIMAIHQNELKFSNSYEYQTVEDIVYHLLYVINKEELAAQKGALHFYYVGDKTKSIAEKSVDTLQGIQNINQMTLSVIGSTLKLQTLCV